MLDHSYGAINLTLMPRASVSQEIKKFLVGISLPQILLMALLFALANDMLNLLDITSVSTLPYRGELFFDEYGLV
jgi:hypothetical protein